jgi:hypothetical protein
MVNHYYLDYKTKVWRSKRGKGDRMDGEHDHGPYMNRRF